MNAPSPIPTPAAIVEAIATCWERGDSISEARVFIKRTLGIALTFDDIHPHFVRLAERWAA